MTRFRVKKASTLFFKALFALVIWGVIAVGVWKYLGDEWGAKGDVTVFEPEIALYTAEFPFQNFSTEGGVYVRARAVVVDVTDSAVLPVTFSLPSDIAAREPAEVGTVIQVERLLEQVGTYGDQTPAYRQNALVRLVDLGFGCTLGEAFIEGDDPPENKDGDGPGFGAPPDDRIPALLARLPHITWEGVPLSENGAQNTARGGLPTGYSTGGFQATPFRTDSPMRRAEASSIERDSATEEQRASDILKRLTEGMRMDDAIVYLGEPQSHATIGSGARSVTQCTWQLPDGRSLTCSFGSDGLDKWEIE